MYAHPRQGRNKSERDVKEAIRKVNRKGGRKAGKRDVAREVRGISKPKVGRILNRLERRGEVRERGGRYEVRR